MNTCETCLWCYKEYTGPQCRRHAPRLVPVGFDEKRAVPITITCWPEVAFDFTCGDWTITDEAYMELLKKEHEWMREYREEMDREFFAALDGKERTDPRDELCEAAVGYIDTEGRGVGAAFDRLYNAVEAYKKSRRSA